MHLYFHLLVESHLNYFSTNGKTSHCLLFEDPKKGLSSKAWKHYFISSLFVYQVHFISSVINKQQLSHCLLDCNRLVGRTVLPSLRPCSYCIASILTPLLSCWLLFRFACSFSEMSPIEVWSTILVGVPISVFASSPEKYWYKVTTKSDKLF